MITFSFLPLIIEDHFSFNVFFFFTLHVEFSKIRQCNLHFLVFIIGFYKSFGLFLFVYGLFHFSVFCCSYIGLMSKVLEDDIFYYVLRSNNILFFCSNMVPKK